MRLSSHGSLVVIRSLVELTRLPSLAHSVALPPTSLHDHGPYRPFGENQLSPGSISILPLSTSHPSELQLTPVRASLSISTQLTLLMDRSPGFGSAAWYNKRFLKLAFATLTPIKGLGCTKRQLVGSFFNRHDITPTSRSSIGLSANSFRFYFTGCLTL